MFLLGAVLAGHGSSWAKRLVIFSVHYHDDALDEEPMVKYTERHIPADTNGGWPFAGGVILLALACIAVVTYIHKQTYRHPTDVTWHGKGSGDAPTPSGGH